MTREKLATATAEVERLTGALKLERDGVDWRDREMHDRGEEIERLKAREAEVLELLPDSRGTDNEDRIRNLLEKP